jgi:uncharacterized membrane protein YgcG
MAQYIPKSKVNILYTYKGEYKIGTPRFSFASNPTQEYNGVYMEFSNGTFFTGNNPNNPGRELVPYEPTDLSMAYFEDNFNGLTYKRLKESIYKQLHKNSYIPIAKPFPLEEDYEIGYFTRYFCKRVNDDFSYFEINKKTHDSLLSRNDNYDYNLYTVGSIKWKLLETPNHPVKDTNNNNITLILSRYPRLNLLFSDLTEHEPLHTRNYKETLYTPNNKIYTGYFHIHPEKGNIMEGPFHSSKVHNILTTDQQRARLEKIKATNIAIKKNILSAPLLSNDQKTTGKGSRRGSTSGGGSTSRGGSTSGGGSGY